MSKKMKLSLEGLKVKSFVTALDKKNAGNVKGGTSNPPTGATACETICDWTEMAHCTYFCGDTEETDVCPETESNCIPE